MIDSTGRFIKNLKVNPPPKWWHLLTSSANGKYIAYYYWIQDTSFKYIIKTDTGVYAPLQMISDTIYRIELATGDITKIYAPLYFPLGYGIEDICLSPDGEKLVGGIGYANPLIYIPSWTGVIDIPSKKYYTLASPDSIYPVRKHRTVFPPIDIDVSRSYMYPVYSPNGKYIAFIAEFSDSTNVGNNVVWVMNSDGTNMHPVVRREDIIRK